MYRSRDEYPKNAIDLINLLSIKSNSILTSKISVVGSFVRNNELYYSDIDCIDKIKIKSSKIEAEKIFLNEIKKLLVKISHTNDAYFTDFKVGDNHFKQSEIMKEKRDGSPDINLKISSDILELKNEIIKLDIIGWYFNRYIECSCVYIIEYEDGVFGQTEGTLKEDITEKAKEGKVYKSLKRILSIAYMENDKKLIQLILPIIRSNIGLLYQILSSVDALELLLKLNIAANKNFISSEIEQMRDQISKIQDIPIDHRLINGLLDKIQLSKLNSYLSEVINNESIIMMRKVGLFPIPKRFL